MAIAWARGSAVWIFRGSEGWHLAGDCTFLTLQRGRLAQPWEPGLEQVGAFLNLPAGLASAPHAQGSFVGHPSREGRSEQELHFQRSFVTEPVCAFGGSRVSQRVAWVSLAQLVEQVEGSFPERTGNCDLEQRGKENTNREPGHLGDV